MCALRTAPSKIVRFDNSDGMVHTTKGCLVRRRSPLPKLEQLVVEEEEEVEE